MSKIESQRRHPGQPGTGLDVDVRCLCALIYTGREGAIGMRGLRHVISSEHEDQHVMIHPGASVDCCLRHDVSLLTGTRL